MCRMIKQKILIIEPYYGGSHKQLLDILLRDYEENRYLLLTLPAKKWHWRARTSALYFSQLIPEDHSFTTLFCSSVLNLAELLGLRPDLRKCRKIIYFHENQLIYPVEHKKERDFQYGYNQIISCMSADRVIFNSEYNRESFLCNIQKHLHMQPGIKTPNIEDAISLKCDVKYFPIAFDQIPCAAYFENTNCNQKNLVHIMWPHRWEHDKNPELFFETVIRLKENDVPFKLSVLGEHTHDVPEVFHRAKEILGQNLLNFGYATNKDEYYRILRSADVVVSTAKHEFFGVAMLEATYCGCLPLAPNDLVYPELYPVECLYKTPKQLYKMLANFCKQPDVLQELREKISSEFDFGKYDAVKLVPEYRELFEYN